MGGNTNWGVGTYRTSDGVWTRGIVWVPCDLVGRCSCRHILYRQGRIPRCGYGLRVPSPCGRQHNRVGGRGHHRTPEDAMEDDAAMAVFGALVAVSGDTMAVASVLRDNARGAVYVYHRVVDANGTVTWQEEAKLEASDGMEGDEFGSSLAMDGNTIVASSVWAMNDDGDIVGKAYVFSKNDEGSWVETDILTASDAQPNAEFGYFVDIVGDTIAVSAPFANRGGEEDPNGMVYIYRYDGADTVSGGNSTWIETFMLSADDASEFGGSLSMHGEYIVVGAPSAPEGGEIYLYGLEGDDWKLEKKFQYPDTVGFGRSVGISEQAVVVTDPIFTRSGMAQSGAAFAVDYLQSNETLC